jgi:hypothetical protein
MAHGMLLLISLVILLHSALLLCTCISLCRGASLYTGSLKAFFMELFSLKEIVTSTVTGSCNVRFGSVIYLRHPFMYEISASLIMVKRDKK